MAFIKTACVALLLISTAWCTEYSPWFNPPFEFQGHISYLYEHANRVQSPKGNFSEKTRNSSLHLGAFVTPWPSWNVEAEIFLTHTSHVDFDCEAGWLTVRYAWLDDISGDPISLVTGATLSFPTTHFLHEFSFPYHGHANAELHATVGKEWKRGCDWLVRAYGLSGFGCGERGSPWVHALGVFEYHPLPCVLFGTFIEALYGLGNNDLTPHFNGYGSIGHQNIDLGVKMEYEIRYVGTLRLLAWHTIHARNFIMDAWGGSVTLFVPFNIICYL